jgi:hypothetical protein
MKGEEDPAIVATGSAAAAKYYDTSYGYEQRPHPNKFC